MLKQVLIALAVNQVQGITTDGGKNEGNKKCEYYIQNKNNLYTKRIKTGSAIFLGGKVPPKKIRYAKRKKYYVEMLFMNYFYILFSGHRYQVRLY